MMGQISVKVSAVLNAYPEDVYATIADYHKGHPRILPAGFLYDLQVEQGGYGAGTVYHARSRVLGIEQTLHHEVSEPEPGRVLVEHDIDSPLHEWNRFTVTPQAQGNKSRVEIAIMQDASPGLRGIVERLVMTTILPGPLHKELKLLEQVAQERHATSV